mmetsp:Transcript_24967/g.86993  ORF Transcript_24967/g.86993 Transcript_24967/m.86993 type:complete len:237 (+) Transcript_24967:289-999(+)
MRTARTTWAAAAPPSRAAPSLPPVRCRPPARRCGTPGARTPPRSCCSWRRCRRCSGPSPSSCKRRAAAAASPPTATAAPCSRCTSSPPAWRSPARGCTGAWRTSWCRRATAGCASAAPWGACAAGTWPSHCASPWWRCCRCRPCWSPCTSRRATPSARTATGATSRGCTWWWPRRWRSRWRRRCCSWCGGRDRAACCSPRRSRSTRSSSPSASSASTSPTPCWRRPCPRRATRPRA